MDQARSGTLLVLIWWVIGGGISRLLRSVDGLIARTIQRRQEAQSPATASPANTPTSSTASRVGRRGDGAEQIRVTCSSSTPMAISIGWKFRPTTPTRSTTHCRVQIHGLPQVITSSYSPMAWECRGGLGSLFH